MQRDVRRSDPTDTTQRAEPAPAGKGRFSRSFFQFGQKRKQREPEPEQGRLQNRLREVLERDRALIASLPEEAAEAELAQHAPQPAEEEVWPDPHALDARAHAPEQVEEQVHEPLLSFSPLPFASKEQTGTRSTNRGLAFNEIASWIEEELGEDLEPNAAPVTLPPEKPLDPDEAAELDAVLAVEELAEEPSQVEVEPALEASTPVDPAELIAAPVAPPKPEPAKPSVAERVAAKPKPMLAGASPSREPINTLTMARLLAMQGYKPRALSVYRELIRRAPDDEALRAEAEALQNAE